MASYPSAKVHRVSRRHLGRGQSQPITSATCVITGVTTTVTLTFDRPVVVSGTIPVAYSGGVTIVSQTQTQPNVVTQVISATSVGKTYALPQAAANVRTYQGGPVNAVSGAF